MRIGGQEKERVQVNHCGSRGAPHGDDALARFAAVVDETIDALHKASK